MSHRTESPLTTAVRVQYGLTVRAFCKRLNLDEGRYRTQFKHHPDLIEAAHRTWLWQQSVEPQRYSDARWLERLAMLPPKREPEPTPLELYKQTFNA